MSLVHSDRNTLRQGDSAPEFSLVNVINGKTVKLSDFKGKAVLVIFMCNHCPYVKPKLDEISKLQKEYLGAVSVVCVSSNDVDTVPEDGPEEMKTLASKVGLQYYLYDETQEAARSYGATCTPDPFLFDKEHKLAFHGRLNDAMNPGDVPKERIMHQKIKKMLSGIEIVNWFLPSMGCSIKWKN